LPELAGWRGAEPSLDVSYVYRNLHGNEIGADDLYCPAFKSFGLKFSSDQIKSTRSNQGGFRCVAEADENAERQAALAKVVEITGLQWFPAAGVSGYWR